MLMGVVTVGEPVSDMHYSNINRFCVFIDLRYSFASHTDDDCVGITLEWRSEELLYPTATKVLVQHINF